MKIRVNDSDGVFRGGLFKTERLLKCRTWQGPPHPHYVELMVDISGYGEPSYEGSWFLLQLSRNPDISGPSDGSDDFDDASKAFCITSREAARWFKNSIFETPPDLLELAKAFKGRGADDDVEVGSNDGNRPLTPAQQKIWDMLEGKAMLGKELAQAVYGDVKRAGAVRKQIEGIRKTGRTIDSKRGFGYFRPDAPPSELGVSAPDLTVKPRPAQAS